ncbi:hypothetical protein [Kibdelosporangium philippinense]|uniref:hypothetical protein n=1 Tax=Kibdelosporangium philippinense TaxID=211113 RepID=UPI0036108651
MRISLLIVTASLGFLAACSGSPEAPPSPQVASVDTGSATPKTSQPPATSERLRYRIDMTDEERSRMQDPLHEMCC